MTILGWLSDPNSRVVGDLHLGSQKVTLNHLVVIFLLVKIQFKNGVQLGWGHVHFY